MPTVYIKTYGCQMNERDSEQVSQTFVEKGFTMVNDENEADVILMNTCSVRDQAERKAIGKMNHIAKLRKKKPEIIYGFMGCMAQSRSDQLLKESPHVDLVVGTQKYHKVVDHVIKIFNKKNNNRMDSLSYPLKPIIDVEEEEGSQNFIKSHLDKQYNVSEFVSIMQGCNMKCSFCIVPDTRGKERSRPIDEIVKECKELSEKGVVEVNLLGQIVNLFGRHEFDTINGKSPFVQLLEEVHKIDKIKRIRFVSPHPIGFRQDLIDAFSYLPKLVDHVHFPMQSGSNRILKKMRRPYKIDKFIDICTKIRKVRPNIAISTDIIVGFPGEEEEDFIDTKNAIKESGINHAFVFRYSPRKDTLAASMDNQIEEKVKEDRNQDLLNMCNEIVKKENNSYVGSIKEVLCEGPSRFNKNRLFGRTRTNQIVVFEGDVEKLTGKIIKTKIESSTGYTLYGTIV